MNKDCAPEHGGGFKSIDFGEKSLYKCHSWLSWIEGMNLRDGKEKFCNHRIVSLWEIKSGFEFSWIWWQKSDGDPFKWYKPSIRQTREQKRTKRQTLELQLNDVIQCVFFTSHLYILLNFFGVTDSLVCTLYSSCGTFPRIASTVLETPLRILIQRSGSVYYFRSVSLGLLFLFWFGPRWISEGLCS